MKPIVVGVPIVKDSRISISIDPGSAKGYLASTEFWVDYGNVNVERVEPAIAVLPALGTLLPVAVALGVEVRAPELDPVFARQAVGIAKALGDMYPHFAQNGFSLTGARRAEKNYSAKERGAAVLYSGGIDSATTLLRHRASTSCLISVWGADVELEDVERWNRLKAVLDRAPVLPGTRHVVARSNLRRVVNEIRLNRQFDHGFDYTDWWGGAHHGLGLTTLAAPVTDALGLSKLLIASSCWPEIDEPWGSSPRIDNCIQWSGGSVVHDAFELNRQRKIQEVIAPWIEEEGDLPIAVCYQVTKRGPKINCGVCEKCMRTISGFLAADLDPARAGIPYSEESLREWRRRLEVGEVDFYSPDAAVWGACQDSLRRCGDSTSIPQAADYLSWLRNVDLPSLITSRSHESVGVAGMSSWAYYSRRVARCLPHSVRRRIRELVP